MPPNPPLDVVSVVTTIALLLWSPALASVIAPYAVIIVAASTGAAWSLSRRDPETRWLAFKFLLRVNAMALLLTISICNGLELYVFHREVKWSLVPVALVIGWIGDDWPAVLGWFTRVGRRVVLRWASEKEGDIK